MYLIKRNRHNEMDFFRRFFDNPLFSNWPTLTRDFEDDSVVWSPRIDIQENEDVVTVKADLPGIDKNDLKVNLENNLLTITGERKYEKEDKGKDVYRSERLYGKFQRSLTLSDTVKSDQIKADYKDGVLTITLPKAEESKPKQIEIK